MDSKPQSKRNKNRASSQRQVQRTAVLPAGMPWFRYYIEALHDPKIVTLSDRQFRAWVNILCVASLGKGVLPPIRDLAAHLRMTVSDAQTIIEDMILAELIDIGPDQSLTPHGWSRRQFTSDVSTNRVQRHRARTDENTRNVTETFHETFHGVSASVVCSLESVICSKKKNSEGEGDNTGAGVTCNADGAA